VNHNRIAVHTDGRLVQGNERQLALLAQGLIARGVEVHVSAVPQTATWNLLQDSGAIMTAVRPRGSLDLVSAWRFMRWLRRIQPSAVLLTSWRRMPLAARAARLAGVPRIVLRLGMVHRPRGTRYRRALRWRIDGIIVNSTTVRDHVLATFPGAASERVHLVHNAAESIEVTHPASIRSDLGLAPGVPLIAAVGGLSRRKGFDILLDAFATLGGDAHLLICGAGDEEQALRAQASDLGIRERVHLIGQRSDVPAVLAACDVFVLSSRAEGFSVAMLEAMRARLPIIASDVGGVRDALGERETHSAAGWIVPVDNAQALAATMQDVLASLHSVETKGRATEAGRRAMEQFSVDAMVDGVLRVLTGAARN